MQMVRARSPLFFQQQRVALKDQRYWRVKEVDHTNNKVTVDQWDGHALTVADVQNHTIALMRAEIAKGVSWMDTYHWTVRTTADPRNLVITSEQPLFYKGPSFVSEAIRSTETFVYFPLCWQACMVGNLLPFITEVEEFAADKLRAFQQMVFKQAREFVISPCELK